jgi:hypothetical protein
MIVSEKHSTKTANSLPKHRIGGGASSTLNLALPAVLADAWRIDLERLQPRALAAD